MIVLGEASGDINHASCHAGQRDLTVSLLLHTVNDTFRAKTFSAL